MASLKKRDDSQFWSIRYRDPRTGKRTREATRFRWNNREETRAARELCAKRTHEEKQARPSSTHRDKWEVWVRDWIESHYHDSPATQSRYLTAWRSIESLLLELGIEYPARLDHTAVRSFIDRRRQSRRGKQKKNRKPIAPGTISTDVKVLRLVMDEAIRRKFATVNPCLRLGLSRKPLREIYEIKVEEEKIIREHLATSPEEMNIQFEIAMAQGCRFSETRIDLLRDVDLEAKPSPTVKIHGKGGKVYQTTLSPRLVPLFQALITRGDRYTWDLPQVKRLQCGRNWTRFFKKKAKLPHIWFHCTRGTAITRAHRAGVSFPKAMRFFNHASTLVHFIYTQLGIEDVSEVAEAVAAFSDSSGVPRYNLCNASPVPSPSARPERQEPLSGRRTGKRSRRRASR